MNCNGAGACGYLTGEQGQAVCKRCGGASYAVVNVADNTQDTEGSNLCSSTCVKCSGGSCVAEASGQDLFSQCAASYNGCSSICVKTGPDGNCNGASACNTGGASANTANGYYCSAGSEVSGACNSAYACSNAVNTNGAYNNAASPYWTQGYCGAGACTRSGANGNGDDSTTACTCVRSASGYWNIGGEVAGTTCCGDDSSEYKRTRVCTSGCTTSAADDACCNANNKCVYSSTCYANAACYTSLKCNAGSWVSHCSNSVMDCDETGTDCGGSCTACPTCSPVNNAADSAWVSSCTLDSQCSSYGRVCRNYQCCLSNQCGSSGTNRGCWNVGHGAYDAYYGSYYGTCVSAGVWGLSQGETCNLDTDCCSGVCINNYCCAANQCAYGPIVARGTCYAIGSIVSQGGVNYKCCSEATWKLPTGATCAIGSQCCSGTCTSLKCA